MKKCNKATRPELMRAFKRGIFAEKKQQPNNHIPNQYKTKKVVY